METEKVSSSAKNFDDMTKEEQEHISTIISGHLTGLDEYVKKQTIGGIFYIAITADGEHAETNFVGVIPPMIAIGELHLALDVVAARCAADRKREDKKND